MKTQMLILVATSLILSACEKDSNLASLDQIQYESALSPSGDASDIIRKEDIHASGAGCVELTTTHWLRGTAIIQVPKVIIHEEEPVLSAGGGRGAGACYVITACGDGASELLARCTSELQLRFNTLANTVQGVMISQFYFGQVLEQTVEGVALVRQDGKNLIVTTSLNVASLDTDDKMMTLDAGEFTFTIPQDLTKPIDVNVETTGMYCIQ